MVTEREAKLVAEHLVKSIAPVCVVMFGSVATKGKGEDLDLLIVTDDGSRNLRDLDAEVRRRLKPFFKDFAIDPLVLPLRLVRQYFMKGSPFLRLIQRQGRSLYMRESVGQWLKQAREDLSAAKYLLDGDFFRGACHNAQQAIEKTLKANLIERGWELERTYSIERLIAISEQYRVESGIEDDDAIFVDSVYRGRYPAEEGLIPTAEPSRDDAVRAVRIASDTLARLERTSCTAND